MIKFEKVKRFQDVEFDLPTRKTKNSAGYDFVVAEDITIPTWTSHLMRMSKPVQDIPVAGFTLEEIAAATKETGAKPTLVSSGVKCYLPEGYYLELSVRSSTPLKYWLVLANGVGIIDADYADNKDNEGEIFFQLINLSPFPIRLKKGDIIGQGILKKYYCTDDDRLTMCDAKRIGGFGSTSAADPEFICSHLPSSFCNNNYDKELSKRFDVNNLPTTDISEEVKNTNLKTALDNFHKIMYKQMGLANL